ncbi:MAG: hypothetical protein IKM20_08260 [Erysipelotrichales bacterium]|nr:hypothetical protein [Erysipelotrichales bacterium]
MNIALSFNFKSFSIKEFSASHYTEIELGIINAILICYIYIDKNNPEIKSAYEKLTNFLEEKHIDDFEIAFNIYYEYLMLCCIQNLDLNMRLELALDTAQLALDNGIANKLPFIYYQIALIYTDLGDKENMEEYYSTAIFLYKQIGVPEAYLNKLIANREECRKIVENPEAYR